MLELNKIYCWDCLELMKLIPDKSIDLVLTDPPYNISLKPQRGLTNAIENDNMPKDDFVIFLDRYFSECNRILKNDTFVISFLSRLTIPEFRSVCDKYFELKSMPIRVKNNFWIGYYTRPQYEPMLLYLKWRPPVLENPISDVIKEDKIQVPVHSCEKPVNLYRYLLDNFSKKWDIVFEWFGWVCWLAQACKQLGRQYIICEVEAKYIDIANKRLQYSQVGLF